MPVIYDIHPEDEMGLYLLDLGRSPGEAVDEYMQTGFAVYAVLSDVLRQLGRPLSSADKLLDFASGHGRTTRFFLQDLHPGQITVADIYPSAVEFQKRRFGVDGFVSTADPDALWIDGRYDIVTCISLFTHLPRELFSRWLHKLASACKPDGVLLFTTHGMDTYDGPEETVDRDFLFVAKSESRSLDVEIYGTSYVTSGFVRETVATIPGGWYVMADLHRSLGGLQVLHVIVPGERPERGLQEVLLPTCYLDRLDVGRSTVTFSGWACSAAERAPVRSVRAHVDDRPVGDAELGLSRPDVAAQLHAPQARRSGFRGSFPYREAMPARPSSWRWSMVGGCRSGSIAASANGRESQDIPPAGGSARVQEVGAPLQGGDQRLAAHRLL